MPSSHRSSISALIAVALGVAAGWLAVSWLGMPQALLPTIYEHFEGLVSFANSYPNGELVLAAIAYRIPNLFIVGLVLGLVLSRIRYQGLLMCSVLIWPLYLILRRLLLIAALVLENPNYASAFLSTNVVPEVFTYLLQYTLVFSVTFSVHFTLRRFRRHNPPVNPDAPTSGAPVT